jgi:hypothetical protein
MLLITDTNLSFAEVLTVNHMDFKILLITIVFVGFAAKDFDSSRK